MYMYYIQYCFCIALTIIYLKVNVHCTCTIPKNDLPVYNVHVHKCTLTTMVHVLYNV